MPTIEQNLHYWQSWPWDEAGEEWSAPWGSTPAVWRSSILPRIGGWLPCGGILEIAVGNGRISQFLIGECEHFVGVDLAPKCVEACRQRFASFEHAEFHATDGRSLAAVADASIDFAFSWDSLVHCDDVSLRGYLGELRRTLREGGVAFLHHSNLEALISPQTARMVNEHDRDEHVSARTVREWAVEADLVCTSQEIVAYPGKELTDCFSTLVRGDGDGRETSIVENRGFEQEIADCRAP